MNSTLFDLCCMWGLRSPEPISNSVRVNHLVSDTKLKPAIEAGYAIEPDVPGCCLIHETDNPLTYREWTYQLARP